MNTVNEITKITQFLRRSDGTEVRIVAEAFFGRGLHRSVGVMVHQRENVGGDWVLRSNTPHPDWRSMSVQEYKEKGKSPMLQTVSSGELLRAISLIGTPMPE